MQDLTIYTNPIQQDFSDAIGELQAAIDDLRDGIADISEGSDESSDDLSFSARMAIRRAMEKLGGGA